VFDTREIIKSLTGNFNTSVISVSVIFLISCVFLEEGHLCM